MITAIILANDSTGTLDECLKSVSFCSQLLIVQDGDNKSLSNIAKKHQAKLVHHSLNNDFSSHRNFALSQVQTEWALFIDSDEIVTAPLSKEIEQVIKSSQYVGVYLPRQDYLWRRHLKHGDTANVKLLRLAKTASGKWIGKVHETWQVDGPTTTLTSPLLHYPHPNVSSFLSHLNHYSSIRAQELQSTHQNPHILQVVFYPVGKFIYLYLLKLGLLDGVAGFVHAMLMSFYSFLVRGKLYLLNRGISTQA